MPIVNYRCHKCGKEFAKLFFDSQNAPRACPVCGAAHIEELGLAFPEYDESIERFARVSCEGCGVDSCGIGSSN